MTISRFSEMSWQERARLVADMDQRTARLGPKENRPHFRYAGEDELSDDDLAAIELAMFAAPLEGKSR